MDKKIIVTGAMGFIGSNLLAKLEHLGYTNIIAIDNFGKETKWKNVAKRTSIEFKPIEDLFQYVTANASNIQAIIHLGAVSSTVETDVDLIIATNYTLTISLYRFCKIKSIQFIYSSSAATYGNGNKGFNDVQDFDSLRKFQPLNAYGWSKHQTDLYISRNGGFENSKNQTVALKFFNVYGPNEYHKGSQSSVIYTFYNQLNSIGKIKLFRSFDSRIQDGEQKRDFVFVEDCVDIIIWFLTHPSISGIYNVGSGQSNTFNYLAQLVSKNCKLSCKIEYIPFPNELLHKYQNYTCADIHKLREAGYQKEMTPLSTGIREYIMSYLTKQDKYI